MTFKISSLSTCSHPSSTGWAGKTSTLGSRLTMNRAAALVDHPHGKDHFSFWPCSFRITILSLPVTEFMRLILSGSLQALRQASFNSPIQDPVPKRILKKLKHSRFSTVQIRAPVSTDLIQVSLVRWELIATVYPQMRPKSSLLPPIKANFPMTLLVAFISLKSQQRIETRIAFPTLPLVVVSAITVHRIPKLVDSPIEDRGVEWVVPVALCHIANSKELD